MLPSRPWAQLSVTKGVAPSCCFILVSIASTNSQAGSFGCVGASLSGGGCGSWATRGVLLPNQALIFLSCYSLIRVLRVDGVPMGLPLVGLSKPAAQRCEDMTNRSEEGANVSENVDTELRDSVYSR